MLNDANIDDKACFALSAGLKFAPKLEDIDLKNNRIMQEGAKILAGVLKYVTSLKVMGTSLSCV